MKISDEELKEIIDEYTTKFVKKYPNICDWMLDEIQCAFAKGFKKALKWRKSEKERKRKAKELVTGDRPRPGCTTFA